MSLSSAEIFEDPSTYVVDPGHTASIGTVWSGFTLYASIFMLTNKQTIFRCSYFAGVLGLIYMNCVFAEVFWHKMIVTFE